MIPVRRCPKLLPSTFLTAEWRPCGPLRLRMPRPNAISSEAWSPRSRRDRFHGAVNGLTDAMARYLTRVDQRRHVALGADRRRIRSAMR